MVPLEYNRNSPRGPTTAAVQPAGRPEGTRPFDPTGLGSNAAVVLGPVSSRSSRTGVGPMGSGGLVERSDGGLAAQRRGGASARRRYREMRRAWRRRARRVFVSLWLLSITVLIVSVVLSEIRSLRAYWCGLVADLVMAITVALHQGPPGWVEKWQVGAWGEERTYLASARNIEGGPVLHGGVRSDGQTTSPPVLEPIPGGRLVLTDLGAEADVAGV
jgi:hypothetical protein